MNPHFALLDSFVWWARLSAAQHLFYGIGIVAGLATLVMAFLGFIGLEHHDIADATHMDVDHGGGGLLSVKPLTGFFLGFGWGGGIALDLGLSLVIATLVALGVGAVMMAVVAALIRAIYSLRNDGTRRIGEAVGAVGTVYVTLPPGRTAGGQITVTVSGRQETLAALNASGRPVPSGEKVRVLAVVDTNTVLVEPLG